jgi:hypothetical protein
MKRTVVNQREVTQSGVIQIRLRKEVVEDGNVIAFEYHRTCIEPGVDPDAHLALVNVHLNALGFPAVDEEGIDSIRRLVKAEHNARVIEDWKALKVKK